MRSRALGSPSAEPAEAGPSFLPMRVVAPEAVAPRTAPPIEIVFPAGPTVRVPFGFDPRTLGDILAVLGGRPC